MLGRRLKILREEKGLTQQQLADVINLSQQTIGHYEVDRAKPDVDTLNKLTSFFQVSADYILGRTNIRAPIETIAAHHEGDEWTEDELEDIENFKDFVRMKREKK